jgi:glucokinase
MTILIVDIGGTYMRLALSQDGQNFISDPQKIKTEIFSEVTDALLHYIEQNNYRPQQIEHILIAKSGRNNWDISGDSILKIFTNSKFSLINDFEANALGLVDAIPNDLMHLGGEKLVSDAQYPMAVIGSGTGLGLAYISILGKVQQTHGGHMLPAITSREQLELFAELQNFKTIKTIPIYEDALSGNGLLNIYKILSGRHHLDCDYTDTHQLLATGRNNPLVQQSLKFYHEILGLFAHQVLAFGYSYGALYLTGGVTDRIITHDLFDRETFFKNLYQNNVPVVLDNVKSTPVFWVKDEFISLKGLLKQAASL